MSLAFPLRAKPSPFQRGNRGAAGRVAELVACPHLRKIDSIDLSGHDLGPADAAALASSDVLSNLTHLRLSDNRIGDDGAVAVADSTTLNKLSFLSLASNDIRSRGVIALAQSRVVSGLVYLGLTDNRVGVRGVMSLFSSNYLADTEVEADRGRIGREVVAGLRAIRPKIYLFDRRRKLIEPGDDMKLLNVKQASESAGVSDSLVFEWCAAGLLVHYRRLDAGRGNTQG